MNTKKTLPFLLAALLLTGCQERNSTLTSEDVAFDKKAGIITDYLSNKTNITIPDNLDGVAVTAIGMNAFYQSGLTNVIIPDSVTEIGDGAFMVNALTSVVIPNSVTTIGHYSFGNNALASVTIPDSVTSLAVDAFDKGVSIKR